MENQKSKSEIKKNRVRKEPRGFMSAIVKSVSWLGVFLFIAGGITAVGIFMHISEDLPKISKLSDYHPPTITTVYSDDNRKIGEFFKERRVVVSLAQMPQMLLEAFIAAEDSRFYKHKGVDFLSILRAMFKNIEAGSIVQGGSTITQQVTKSFLLTPEKNFTRKIKEAILAYRIDKSFTKEEVLYLYLNQIYLGHGAYGVEAAAGNYFGKSVNELNLAECAMLAGLPQAPSRYSPFRHPERAKQRQNYVLNRMVEEGFISNTEATEAYNIQLDIKPRKNWYIEEVPSYTEHVRQYIQNTYGADILYNEGLQVYTAVNIEMQKIARVEIEKELRTLDKRQGYRGPLKHLAKAEIETFFKELKTESDTPDESPDGAITGVVVSVDDNDKKVRVRMAHATGTIALADMRWARKPDPEVALNEAPVRLPGEVLSVGDVILVAVKGQAGEGGLIPLSLEQTPAVQAALMCVETETGHVKTMVGGRDFRDNQFNRAIQSRRQPGSAFKPIIYAAAMDKGFTPASMIVDSPIFFKDRGSDFKWQPKNYEEKFNGPTLLRDALAKSRNIISIKLLQQIGVKYAIDYAHKLGIESPLSQDLSIALGSSGVSLLELLSAYSVFANHGYMVQPVFITKIVDRNGNVLELNSPTRKKVIEKSTAYIITSMLESVVKDGTGWRAKELQRPVAGKTGTTNNLNDAWFIGYTPEYVTGTWVGFDGDASLGKGETGSRAASPIWVSFMKQVLADKPVQLFEVPEGVVYSKIDSETGLMPSPESNSTRFEVFKEGTQPRVYTKREDTITETENLYKSDL
jgi:penicillin-binding protein 1A